jgi:hypothetical protein
MKLEIDIMRYLNFSIRKLAGYPSEGCLYNRDFLKIMSETKTMGKYLQLFTLLLLTAYLMSCGPSLKVTHDYDKAVNFDQYKTFALYNSDSIHDAISPLNQQRILNSVKSEMAKKGFQENTGTPDVLVNVTAILQNRVAVSSTTDYYGYGGAYRPYYWGGGMGSSTTNYNVQHYKDGSLIIDVIDASSKKLIWQGIGNKEIDKPAKDPDAAISKAVASIMESFPPGKAKKS